MHKMLKEIAEYRTKLQVPMTINPRPYDIDEPSPMAQKIYGLREEAEKLLFEMGLVNSFTCTPYYDKNVPKQGDVLRPQPRSL